MKEPDHYSRRLKYFLNKHTMIIYLLIVFIFYSFMSLTFEKGKWNLKKAKEGIKVYIRDEPSTGLPEYKGITKIAAPIQSLIAVLRDVDEYPNLFVGTKTAKLLREEQDLQICYMHNECSFPFSDRDAIYKSIFYHDAESGKVSLIITALPDYLPEQSKKVRVPVSKGLWILKPLNDGTVDVLYQQYADPGGNLPNWIIRLYSVNIPYKALKCLRRQVKLPKYQVIENEMPTSKEQVKYNANV